MEQTLTPTVSVVLPCRNERAQIEDCLRSILEQEGVAGGFEVVVADGMSDDGTREILQKLARADQRLKVIDNPEQMTPYGMNAGIRASRGRYIAIMGAHHFYARDYLRSALDVLRETGADNVGGSMVCVGQTPVQKAIAVAHHSGFAAGGARWHNANYSGPADTVFGGVYRREVFERIGFFDEELARNQDDEFNLRLTKSGGKIWHSPRIRSWCLPRASLGALFRQYLQYGYWKVRVIQKHKLPASVRHLVPGCFVLSLLILTPAAFLWGPAAFVLSILVVAYGCCNLVASLLTAGRSGLKFFPLLPLVFATYHFAYGYGFLRGIWDFLILRRGPDGKYARLTRVSPARVPGAPIHR